ncbi:MULTISPECIES: MerR family transcriptional regulator [Castellaniella]|uniref:MerR family transcriptional regulator n=2 Tax=Castellaniella TaxID=359336 RepID=A0AB39D943_9BURK|nr:MerR family transcriptional regulator [Castellaniella sp.]HET8703387.1 MerR family transcriptional regulator [Castellaniella sp.]
MNISRVAKQAGVSIETIRYYQRRGLIAVPAKPLGSHRRYSQDIVDRIRFIKRAQSWGFSLDEIAILSKPLSEVGCVQVQNLVQEKIHSLNTLMRNLGKTVKGLESLLAQCQQQQDCALCPLRGGRQSPCRPGNGQMPCWQAGVLTSPS